MTMNLPMISALDLTGYPVDYRALTDMTPFTYRAGMTYEGLLESIRVWIPNTLIPYLNDNFAGIQDSWIENVTGVEAQLEAALEAIATAQVPISDPVIVAAFNAQASLTRAALDARYEQTGYGELRAPAPTGDPTIDTPNLIAAFAAAKAAQNDLRLTVSALGTVKYYKVNQALTWSLSRGSLIGSGHVGIDFSAIASTYVGAGLLVQGEQGNFNYGSHLAGQHRIEGIRFIGHDTDTSTLDGVLVADTAGNIDQGRFVSCFWYGFHDGITFGNNAWSIDFMKCSVSHSHRYGINLTSGSNTGECISLTHTSIFGTTNATKTAAAIYAPASSNVEFRMIGGSLDYNDMEGRIQGGQLSFHMVHIEDNSTNAMFSYTQSTSVVNVSFRDCSWDSSTATPRAFIHNILAGTGSKITINFEGDKGGVYPGTNSTWLYDSSNNRFTGDWGISTRIRGWHMDTSTGMLLGQVYSILPNGDFSTSSSFVASPGVGGWSIPASGTWTIGAGGNPGAALQLVASSAVTGNTVQRVPIPISGEPIRIAGKMMVTALSAGSIQAGMQFLAADGVTTVGAGTRINSVLTTVDSTNWTYFGRRFTPPPGAAYVSVQLGANAFVGTALWDEIEVVPV